MNMVDLSIIMLRLKSFLRELLISCFAEISAFQLSVFFLTIITMPCRLLKMMPGQMNYVQDENMRDG